MIAAERPPVAYPAAPPSLAAAGLTLDLVLQLALKTLLFGGDLTGAELGARLGLHFAALEPAMEMLKQHRHIEITGGSLLGGAAYTYRITDAGRARAALFLEHSQYVGIAPVPLAQYRDYMRRVQVRGFGAITRQTVERAFQDLVLSERVLDQLGPAILGGHSLFVYGPPGNGKTVISRTVRNLLGGTIAIPHALDVEGNIVRFFDPVNHEPVVRDGGDRPQLASDIGGDRRWVECRRPLVVVGGELTLDTLELSYSPTAKFYRAPVQAIANGGVLVIDDFGRQRCSPRELLNRWMVPLESRVDFLTLESGQKCELPFHALVVFATNLQPTELVDEAFLRRIQYKVFAESPTPEEFVRIFERCCADQRVPFERHVAEALLRDYYRPRRLPLRGCHPRDLIARALALAEYRGIGRRVTPELLEAACASYFLDPPAEAVA